MNQKLRGAAEKIAKGAIAAVCPDEAVRRALENIELSERVYLVAIGKAAWQMAAAAVKYLDRPVYKGIVLTKYDHVLEELPNIVCYEAGHPVPDENSYQGTQAVLDMTGHLKETDTVLFLLSGGGSALFEKPLVDHEVLQSVTRIMLGSGADITEMNTIRKRLSAVKGGKFAQWCQPAHMEAIILSDILGDPVDMIASGPAAADPATTQQAMAIAQRYHIDQLPGVQDCLRRETVKELHNVHTQVIGSVRQLCMAAAKIAGELGYEPVYLSDELDCEAKQAGQYLAEQLLVYHKDGKKRALIAGGETVVQLTGNGLGGRNQELALAAAEKISGLPNVALISVGSDGTDGPTDAAGGYVDGDTLDELAAKEIDYWRMLENNDSYHALQAVGNLIITGPTGTNVNDVMIGLIDI